MGGGIAMNFANAGIPVMVLEMKPEALERGIGIIRKNYESSAKKGKLTPEKLAERTASSPARFPTTTSATPTS
jgi:3-hydroxyacyl-CoA dehydrogenase